MSTIAPFGTWPSPITPGTITTRTVHLVEVRVDGADTYWVEQRASQAGRSVLLRRGGDGSVGSLIIYPKYCCIKLSNSSCVLSSVF